MKEIRIDTIQDAQMQPGLAANSLNNALRQDIENGEKLKVVREPVNMTTETLFYINTVEKFDEWKEANFAAEWRP